MKTRISKISLLLAISFIAVTGINAKVASELSLTNAADPELKIEAWMVEDDYWSSSANIVAPDADEALEIEQWMINDCYWR